MGKQIVMYPCTVILLRNKKDWTIAAVNNMDDSQDDYTEWKKPVQKKKKEYVLCDQIYIKFRGYLGIWEQEGDRECWEREIIYKVIGGNRLGY